MFHCIVKWSGVQLNKVIFNGIIELITHRYQQKTNWPGCDTQRGKNKSISNWKFNLKSEHLVSFSGVKILENRIKNIPTILNIGLPVVWLLD